jgi:hypothetical protein
MGIRTVFLGLVLLGFLFTGCVTIACDTDDPKLGQDCYECTRKATVEVQQVDSDTGRRISIKDRTEECLRERGYVKQKKESLP